MFQEFGQPPYSSALYLSATDGLIKLLNNTDDAVRLHALRRLHDLVAIHSHDLKQYISEIETLTNDYEFKYRELAILLLARIHFYNKDQKNALNAALTIPNVFVKSFHTEFSENLIGEMLDILMSAVKIDSNTTPTKIDDGDIDVIGEDDEEDDDDDNDNDDEDVKNESIINCNSLSYNVCQYSSKQMNVMETIVVDVVNDCGISYNEKQAVGIALELRKISILKNIVSRQRDPRAIIRYIVSVVTRFFYGSEFRFDVYNFAIDELNIFQPCDYSTLFFCLTRINNADKIAEILINLAVNDEHNPDSCCIATQLCFDLYENAMPKLIEDILLRIKYCDFYREGKRVTFESSTKKKVKSPADRPSYTSVVLEPCSDFPPVVDTSELMNSEEFTSLTVEEQQQRVRELQKQSTCARLKYIYEKLTKFIIVLRGKATVRLWFEYIVKTMRSDSHILRLLRNCVKSSLSMTAVIFANGIMHCGTTGDSFAREHAEWFGKCSNWSKFAYVVSYGLIHSGNHSEGMRVLGSFLPRVGGGSVEKKYEESGAICALGFIFGNRSSKAREFILHNFYSATNSVIFHGCCLGVGLAWFGCYDNEILSYLWNSIEGDDPIKSLGACVCYGMVSIGHFSDEYFVRIKKLLMETKHEKSKIGASVMVAFAHTNSNKSAWCNIRSLLDEKRGACRLAAAYTIGMAFVGTGDIDAVKTLWELVIYDVDDHVKRAAIISLAFVLLRDKPQLYDIMTQLFNSHNSMVRCASALALGIVFAGTGNPDAYVLVSNLFLDIDVRVRQSAYMSAAMIMMHLNESEAPASKTVRDSLLAVINNSKSIDQLVRFGAIIGIGLIDAGGKNMAISYFTNDGSVRTYSVVGMLLFAVSYYWYPLIGFITMAFVPPAIIAVKDDFSIPIMKFISNKPQNYFKYASFSHQSRRINRNKTSSKLSAHRKSRKSKRVMAEFRITPTNNSETKLIITQGKDKHVNIYPIQTSPVDKISDSKTAINENKEDIIEKKDKETANNNMNEVEMTDVDTVVTSTTECDNKSETTKYNDDKVASSTTYTNTAATSDKVVPVENDGDNNNVTAIYDSAYPSHNLPADKFTVLYNPSRVLPCLWNTIVLDESCGYYPYKPINSGGIIVVRKVGKGPEYLMLEPLQVKIVSSKPKTSEQNEPAKTNPTDKSSGPPSAQ